MTRKIIGVIIMVALLVFGCFAGTMFYRQYADAKSSASTFEELQGRSKIRMNFRVLKRKEHLPRMKLRAHRLKRNRQFSTNIDHCRNRMAIWSDGSLSKEPKSITRLCRRRIIPIIISSTALRKHGAITVCLMWMSPAQSAPATTW